MSFKVVVLSLFFLTVYASGDAQVIGSVFPKMVTETAEDEELTLPESTKGKYTLLGLAYSKRSESDLNTWFSPIYNTFIRENTGLFSSFAYDVNVYFVPMFTGVKAAATGTAKNKAVKNLDPKLLPHIFSIKAN